MKELVFLPDREGRDTLTNAYGFVRFGVEGEGLSSLTDRLVLPPKEQTQSADDPAWRGVLAMTLLCDAWPDSDATVEIIEVDGTTSLFAAWVLSARPAEERRDVLRLVVLQRGDERRLLGVADPHAGLRLPATATDFTGFVPARAVWYDEEQARWLDPTPFLNEQERTILLGRLTLMHLDSAAADSFRRDLEDVEKPAAELIRSGDPDALSDFSNRLQALCGLKDFAPFSMRQENCCVAEDHPLVRLFSAVDLRYAPEKPCTTYFWNDVPFARSSAALGLTNVTDPRQWQTLGEIESELRLLTESSVRWNQRCAERVGEWLDAQDPALLPETRVQAEAIRQMRHVQGREVQTAVTLEWPWDASSGAVRYILREALGDGWMRGAANPFSDRLTKLTGHVLGDNALQHCCACADGVLLPPLSEDMALCVAAAADGEGLALDMMRFEPREDGGITASFLLRGAGEICMVRVYPVEEICVLSEAASPSVAVWPCLPMERWRAYHVFARGGEAEIAALDGGEWVALAAEAPAETASEAYSGSLTDMAEERPLRRPWRCLHTKSYPACLMLRRDGLMLGALPNALPLCRIDAAAEAQIAIDMGASTTAVAMTLDGKPASVKGEPLTRLLVMPQELPADDFLIGLTPSELTPSAVLLTGEGDTLFEDGYVYTVSSFEALQEMAPGEVCTALKWRADARSVRARRILLHQVMLGASLSAMLAGAKSVSWRLTIADEMGDEGREALVGMAEELASLVAEETGLALTMGQAAVRWAEEAAALHAFLCAEGGMKGSFAVLDIGGGSTKLHLWLQGRSRPTGGAVLMTGASTVLLNVLRNQPELLRADFADCGNQALIAAVDVLCDQLAVAGESLAQADKALLMLDALLVEYKPAIVQHLYARFNAQRPTCMQAILLEMYAAAIFNVGLMLEQAGEDTNINHLFPADLTICLTGRGAWMLESLTPQLRNGLQRIGREPMALRHAIRTLTVRPAALPALGTALGMAALRETGVTIDPPGIRTRQSFSALMRMLVSCLNQCCPMHMWTLHPGLVDPWGNMTPAGEDTIRRIASASYGEGEDIPASVMDFMEQLRNAAILPDMVFAPGDMNER